MSRLSEINVRTYLNSEFEASFLVMEVKSGKQKNGNMFLSVIMKDRDIEVEAKFFNASQDVINFITPGKIIKAVVKVQEYDKAKDGISCILESVGDDDTG
jgi:23S rRNA maturation-related 3'-5' exoribonuclease YhaM